MEFKKWLFAEASGKELQQVGRWLTALGANLGYLANAFSNNPMSLPEPLRKENATFSAALQAVVKAADAIMGTRPGEGRGDPNWIETNRPTVEALLGQVLGPLQKLLPFVPADMGKIAENGRKVLDMIAAAGVSGPKPATPPPPKADPTQQALPGPEPISVKKLEFDFRLKPGTLDIQMLSKTNMVSVRNKLTGKVVSVKPDRESIERGVAEVI